MEYYVLLEKKERGCPVGSMQGIVYDKFVGNVDELEYGLKPWYNPFDEGGKIFPGEMFLISRDKLIAYDIRSGGAGSKFNLISSAFLDVLKGFGVPMREVQPINIVDRSGGAISKKSYFIVSFDSGLYEDPDDVLSSESILLPDEFGGQFSIESLSIRSDVKRDFFKIKNLYPGQDPIFCSEKFVAEVKDKKADAGVEFRNIAEVDWMSTSPDDFMGFLQSDSEPLLFIH